MNLGWRDCVYLRRNTNRPTNQPMQTHISSYDDRVVVPTCYISLRVTIAHSQWPVIEALIKDYEWYLCYPHSGKEGNNEHFHCLLPGCTNADREKLRKRFKKAGYSGNKFIGVKLCENSVTSGIGYCTHEGTQPITKGDVQSWINEAPEWVENRVGKKRKNTDDYVILNVTNLLRICFEYRRQENIHSTDIKVVMRLMLNSGKYFFSPTLLRQGAPDWFPGCFEDSCELGRLEYNEKHWGKDIFRSMQNRF